MKPKIVVIDSGLGGLTIFKQLIAQTSNIHFVADNKHFPYGTKKTSELVNIIDRLIHYFLNNQYDKVILACNTASLIYDKYLRYKYKNEVITIIDSTIAEIENIYNLSHVGIIATNKVIESNIYQDYIKRKYQIRTTTIACSELVNLCENYDKLKINAFIKQHFSIFKENKIDALILACTHFNIIEKEIDRFFKHEVPLICSGYGLSKQLKLSYLCFMCGRNQIFLTNNHKNYVEKIRYLFPEFKNIKIKSLNI